MRRPEYSEIVEIALEPRPVHRRDRAARAVQRWVDAVKAVCRVMLLPVLPVGDVANDRAVDRVHAGIRDVIDAETLAYSLEKGIEIIRGIGQFGEFDETGPVECVARHCCLPPRRLPHLRTMRPWSNTSPRHPDPSHDGTKDRTTFCVRCVRRCQCKSEPIRISSYASTRKDRLSSNAQDERAARHHRAARRDAWQDAQPFSSSVVAEAEASSSSEAAPPISSNNSAISKSAAASSSAAASWMVLPDA